MKICLKCGQEKQFSEYHKKRGKPQPQCKACRSAYMKQLYIDNIDVEKAKRKAWYEKNKLKVCEQMRIDRKKNAKQINFKNQLKRRGVTEAEYTAVLKKQRNSCGICKEIFVKTPHFDHCHKSGQFRGLLCSQCNTGLGLLGDDIKIIDRAIAYIKKYKN